MSNHCYTLPQAVAVLNLIGDIIQTRICIELGWEEATLEFYMRHPEMLTREDRERINLIIKNHLANLAQHPPQISGRKPHPVHITRLIKSETGQPTIRNAAFPQ